MRRHGTRALFAKFRQVMSSYLRILHGRISIAIVMEEKVCDTDLIAAGDGRGNGDGRRRRDRASSSPGFSSDAPSAIAMLSTYGFVFKYVYTDLISSRRLHVRVLDSVGNFLSRSADKPSGRSHRRDEVSGRAAADVSGRRHVPSGTPLPKSMRAQDRQGCNALCLVPHPRCSQVGHSSTACFVS